MVYQLGGQHWQETGPSGYTYGAVLVRLEGGSGQRPRDEGEAGRRPRHEGGPVEVLAALREIRFSGWVAAPESGWLVAVAATGAGTVAAGRRGVIGVGERLAERLGGPVLAVRVLADRQLLLALWADGDEVGRYVSDPSHGFPADDGVLSEPLGVEHAEAFATACGRPDVADDLGETLAEELDPESVIESERLSAVVRLLGLPGWLVAASALPRDPPTGPRARDLTRLGAGVPGLLGRLCGHAVDIVRRRRPPPPAVSDPPRGRAGDLDPWLL
jgi:hypothetical protein